MFEQIHINYHQILGLISPFFVALKPINILELLVIVFIIWKIYRYITGTHAEQLVKGILMLLVAMVLSKLFNLQIIGKMLESVVNIVVFSLVVIFQPELRKFLGYLGQHGLFNKTPFISDEEIDANEVIDEVYNAVKHLSKSHTGALIVFQKSAGMEATLEVGIKLNAKVSTELLLTIFHPNTPLHDGAVVIKGDTILASSVLLPLTEDPTLSWRYGTRHRAAIGMTEISDVTCLVVSEETGNISMVYKGVLNHIKTLEELKQELKKLYGIDSQQEEMKPEAEQKEIEPKRIESLKSFKRINIGEMAFSKYPKFFIKRDKRQKDKIENIGKSIGENI